jgi:hypothetical protein
MPGLVPGIHIFKGPSKQAWMAGTSPAMTGYQSPSAFNLISHFNTPRPAAAPVANEACSR